MENYVKIEVLVDTSSKEQLSALNTFLSAIGENSQSPCEKKPQPASDPAPQPEPEAPKVAKKKPAKAQPEPTPEPEPQPTPEPEPQPASVDAKEYTVEEVREKLKEKVADHREEIKAKLTEFGAPNVSSLDRAYYAAFVNFLDSLE